MFRIFAVEREATMKPTTLALIAGRLLGMIGALLVVLALTWPWMTLRLSSSVGRPTELQLSFSGSDITALAAPTAALAPKLSDMIDTLIESDRSAGIALAPIREQLTPIQRAGSLTAAWIAAIWLPPIIALVLAALLLITNGELRFRRGVGAALIVLTLISLAVLIATRLRIEGMLAQLRAMPALSPMFDSLDQTGIEISLRSESGVTSAALFAGLVLIGGLIELILPLHALTWLNTAIPAPLPLGAPALQTAPAAEFAHSAPTAPAAPAAGERIPCVECGRPLPLGSRFCGGCGTQQV
jgi:hypothetical protein